MAHIQRIDEDRRNGWNLSRPSTSRRQATTRSNTLIPLTTLRKSDGAEVADARRDTIRHENVDDSAVSHFVDKPVKIDF